MGSLSAALFLSTRHSTHTDTMAKGASGSQVSTSAGGAVARSGGGVTRRSGGGRASGGGSKVRSAATGAPSSSVGVMKFGFNDDSPGLHVQPKAVLIAAVVFIGVVILLHIYGKITRGW